MSFAAQVESQRHVPNPREELCLKILPVPRVPASPQESSRAFFADTGWISSDDRASWS
jgi:hypothetical protein